MNLLISLIIGGIVGWLASMVMKTNAQMGIIANVWTSSGMSNTAFTSPSRCLPQSPQVATERGRYRFWSHPDNPDGTGLTAQRTKGECSERYREAAGPEGRER